MYKQVIILISDLKMTTGKALAQSLHAALGAIKQIDKKIVKKWENEGSKKIVLKASSNELKDIVKKLKAEKIPYFLVKDAGLTQIEPGTITALGIGPLEENKIDNITGKLKLF